MPRFSTYVHGNPGGLHASAHAARCFRALDLRWTRVLGPIVTVSLVSQLSDTDRPLPGVRMTGIGSGKAKDTRAFVKAEVSTLLSTYIDMLQLSHPTDKSLLVRRRCFADCVRLSCVYLCPLLFLREGSRAAPRAR